jgi:predicted nucleotidyltransferase
MTEVVQRTVDALAEDFGAQEIWLFGSMATGQSTEHSDIDLLVVRPARPGSLRPSVEARLCLFRRGICHPFDLLVLTPERWSQARQNPFGVYEEVLTRGVKLYERRSEHPGQLV